MYSASGWTLWGHQRELSFRSSFWQLLHLQGRLHKCQGHLLRSSAAVRGEGGCEKAQGVMTKFSSFSSEQPTTSCLPQGPRPRDTHQCELYRGNLLSISGHQYTSPPQSCSPFSGSRGTRNRLAHGHTLGTVRNSAVTGEIGGPRTVRDLSTQCKVNMGVPF